jgi:hypothetical protein
MRAIFRIDPLFDVVGVHRVTIVISTATKISPITNPVENASIVYSSSIADVHVNGTQ